MSGARDLREVRMRELVLTYVELFKSYEMLIEHRKRLCIADDHLSTAVCTVYASWCAYKIRKRVDSISGTLATLVGEETGNGTETGGTVPKYEAVCGAAQNLLVAVTSGDGVAISEALKEMGVFSFCPVPEQVFSRMEDVASRVVGLAQQVLLVDLSLFAIEAENYQLASKFVQQVCAFDPTSRELYNICVVEGLIALNEGRVNEAVRCLDSSTKACQSDVDASIQCALLAPNLEIASKLLELGEQMAVLRYLFECHNVWQSCRPQIEEWIHIIESGNKPDFQTLEFPGEADKLSNRLNIQWMRACSLEMQRHPVKPKVLMSPGQVLAERERRMAENKTRMNTYVQRKLEYLENDMAASPDQPPPNPADPSQPSEPAA
jgi:hypothetical protein